MPPALTVGPGGPASKCDRPAYPTRRPGAPRQVFWGPTAPHPSALQLGAATVTPLATLWLLTGSALGPRRSLVWIRSSPAGGQPMRRPRPGPGDGEGRGRAAEPANRGFRWRLGTRVTVSAAQPPHPGGHEPSPGGASQCTGQRPPGRKGGPSPGPPLGHGGGHAGEAACHTAKRWPVCSGTPSSKCGGQGQDKGHQAPPDRSQRAAKCPSVWISIHVRVEG